MRVARQPSVTLFGGSDLLAIVQKVGFAEPTFQVRARINTRSRVRLIEDEVARAKEMIETNFEQIGRAGIAGDVAAKFPMVWALEVFDAATIADASAAHQYTRTSSVSMKR